MRTTLRASVRILVTPMLLSCLESSPAQEGPRPDGWQALAFLEGTWEAKAPGDTGTASLGRYTFRRELCGHVFARHSATAACRGAPGFDCDHGDLLYLYRDMDTGPVRAIYFDNEGPVIHYGVTTPAPGQVVFLSEPAPGPRFRLSYARDGASMSGKFQMQLPGQDTWRPYLEWSGSRD